VNTRLEAGLIGLVTVAVPFSLRSLADGYESGTRPLNKDEVVEALRSAALNVEELNSVLLKVLQETED